MVKAVESVVQSSRTAPELLIAG